MNAAAGILFNNSNQLYSLNLDANYQTLALPTRGRSSTNKPSTELTTTAQSTGISQLDTFLSKNADVEFVWMQWVDYTATIRLRMFPLVEFIKIAQSKRKIGITTAIFYLLQEDIMVEGGSVSGIINIEPDLSSLYMNAGLPSGAAKSATVMSFFRDEKMGELEERCPRTTLQRLTTRFKTAYDINFLFGFEIEVILMVPFTPASKIHSWSNMTSTTRPLLPLIESITRTLVSLGIPVEQFHTESAPGQIEFCLPPSTPLAAIDMLIKTRQVIVNMAEQAGLRATLYPRPFPNSAGSASHAHLSLNPAPLAAKYEKPFLAGVLRHLPSIAAFTLPLNESYARVQSGAWGGSEYVAWGSQNREVPLRRIKAGHWEVKCVDGVGNMYLNMAAILAAGYVGMRGGYLLESGDCSVDPSTLSAAERTGLGITTRLPGGIEESCKSLEKDEALKGLLGKGFVKDYVAVRRMEEKTLGKKGEGKRRRWLMERY